MPPTDLLPLLRDWLATQLEPSASVVVSTSLQLSPLPRETADEQYPGYEWLVATDRGELVVLAGIHATELADEFELVAYWFDDGVACGQETVWQHRGARQWELLAHSKIFRGDG